MARRRAQADELPAAVDPAVQERIDRVLARAAHFDAMVAAVRVPSPDVDYDGWRRQTNERERCQYRADALRWLAGVIARQG